MEKLPKSVKVFGQVVGVKRSQLGPDFDGEYCSTKSTITINSKVPKKQVRQTLFHELGHAILDRTGITQGLTKELEEVIVEAMATGFDEVLEELEWTPKKPLKTE